MSSTAPRSVGVHRRAARVVAVSAALMVPAALGMNLLAPVGLGAVAGAQPRTVGTDPLVAPATSLSADGRSATDGTRTLAVSQAGSLNVSGQSIRVTGSGYDQNKGVYIALCVIPPRNVAPSPCGGGADKERTAGAAEWISNNPPSYAVGLARPYGSGGSFDTTFTVSAKISATIDCSLVRCAIVTRNDHTRGSDRSQDIFIPVSFSAPAAAVPGVPQPQTPTTAVGPSTPATQVPTTTVVAPTTSVAPPTITTTTVATAPEAIVATDGKSVTDGTRTLSASAVDDLDPAKAAVEVNASGFDPAGGVFVSLCALDSETNALGACASGEARSRWFTNDPPEWAGEAALPFEGDGFSTELELAAVIDASTDCRQARCVIAVRSDDTEAADRSADLFLPVSFASESEPAAGESAAGSPSPTDAAADTDRDSSTGSGLPVGWILGALAIVLLGGGAGAAVLARRHRPNRATSAQPADSLGERHEPA